MSKKIMLALGISISASTLLITNPLRWKEEDQETLILNNNTLIIHRDKNHFNAEIHSSALKELLTSSGPYKIISGEEQHTSFPRIMARAQYQKNNIILFEGSVQLLLQEENEQKEYEFVLSTKTISSLAEFEKQALEWVKVAVAKYLFNYSEEKKRVLTPLLTKALQQTIEKWKQLLTLFLDEVKKAA